MLNKNTLAILKELGKINESAIIDNSLRIKDNSQSVIARVNLSELADENLEKEIGIYNISEFLNAVGLVDTPTIDIKDNVINISNKRNSVKYFVTDSDIIREICQPSETIIDRTKEADTVANFTLSTEIIDSITKSSAVLGLDTVVINTKDNSMEIQVCNGANAKDYNDHKIGISGNSEKDFSIDLPVKNIAMLPNTEYQVQVKYSEAKDSYRIYMEAEDIDTLEVVCAVSH